FQQYNSNPLTF
nr:immunoglobulin light chain junction region [Macaca mulatta]